MEKIFNQIAENNGVTGKEVKNEISRAIAEARQNSKGNAEAEDFWNNISKKGEEPTPEDVITAIISRVLAQ